jgi:hypothetical protein
MVVALLAPVLVFGIPQLFGLTFLSGDNFIQNFPMRVLVGKDLIHGALPLWNPYLFSGTPLLGGFNAGAAYPATWLTAALPIFTAWTLTLALAYDVALAGMYCFLRRQGITSTAATFGAVTFALAGYMTAQQVHIDLIEGAAWLPWILAAVHGLTQRRPTMAIGPGHGVPGDGEGDGGDTPPAERRTVRRRTRGWVLVLSVGLGLTLLAGAAEAIIDSGVLVGVYWLWRLADQGFLRRGSGRALLASVGGVAAGVAVGVALGTAQWLPGLRFLSQSQRAAVTYSFFTSGSLNNRLLALLASPFALGTNQGWPVTYAGTYNYPEVTSYVGILALIAACCLFLKRWRTRPEARQWWVWYAILVIGVLSSLGNQTPFARLMYLLPGVSSERLLNRNLLLVDVALAVLLAWWVHITLDERAGAGEETGEPASIRARWRAGRRAEVVVTAIPLAVTSVIAALLWVAGPFLGRLLEIEFGLATGARLRLAGLVTAGVIVAGIATWTVLAAGRFSAHRLRRQLAAVLVVDLALFNLFTINPPITEAAAQADTVPAARVAALTGGGRFIVYDPDRFETQQLYALGQTDLNIYRSLPSAQGYTALTDGDYYAATGAHLQETLDAKTLSGPVWDRLNVTTLLALPGYFVTPLPTSSTRDRYSADPNTVAPADRVFFPADPTQHTSTDLGAPTTDTLRPGVARPWYFGGRLTLQQFAVPLVQGAPTDLQVGIVTPSGSERWLPPGDHHIVGTGTVPSVQVDLGRSVAAGGIVLRAVGRAVTVGIPTAVTAETGGVSLDGQLQYGVRAPHWVFTGTVGSFGVFHNRSAQGWAWTRSPAGGPAAGSTVLAGQPGRSGDQRITVHTLAPTELVRSASWTTGWHASVQAMRGASPSTTYGPPRSVPVLRSGVVQAVRLPGPGTYLVTFRYRPAPAVVGMVLSALTGLGLLTWGAAEAVGRFRRRRGSEEPDGPVVDDGVVAPDRADRPQPGGSSPIARADRA